MSHLELASYNDLKARGCIADRVLHKTWLALPTFAESISGREFSGVAG